MVARRGAQLNQLVSVRSHNLTVVLTTPYYDMELAAADLESRIYKYSDNDLKNIIYSWGCIP